MENELLKLSIEDVAFAVWNGIQNVGEFAAGFLEKYPGFCDIWEWDELATALRKRV